jgi:hypothetical protein
VFPGQIWRDPLRSTLPIPGAIEALVAFVDDQAKFVHWLCRIAAGFAERDTLGALGAGGGGAAALTGQSAFAMFVASMAIAIPSLVRQDK